MHIPALLDDMPGQILLMHPLHDDDASTGLGVIEPGTHRLIPPVERRSSNGIALAFGYVMWIIHDNTVASFAGGGGADAHRQPAPAFVIIEPLLGILIARQAEVLSPVGLEPRRFDEPPAADGIADAQRHRI